MTEPELSLAQAILHYVYPFSIFLYFTLASIVVLCRLQAVEDAQKSTHIRRKIIWYLLFAFVLTYAVQVIVEVIEIISYDQWPSQDKTIGHLACILVFGIQQSNLSDTSNIVWYPFYGSWLIALIFEPVSAALLVARARAFVGDRRIVSTQLSTPAVLRIDAAFSLTRTVILLGALSAYFVWRSHIVHDASDEERSPLISKPGQMSNNADGSSDSGYGTNTDATNTGTNNTHVANSPTEPESSWERQDRLAREKMEKRLKDEGSWITYLKGFWIFYPYIWPVNNRRLQLYAALVGLCLLAGNGLNFLIPRQYGAVMDSLSGVSGKNPWVEVMVFAVLRLMASESGISLLRQLLWLPVEMYSSEAICVAAYSHVMNLSSEFHDTKSSSDLLVAISNASQISDMLESICFQAIPMMIDLVVAFTYLSVKFGPYEGFITLATGLAFVQSAARLITNFKDKRKMMVKRYYEEHYARQAGIQGWHTVSAFNQVPYEEDRYAKAVKAQVDSSKSIYAGYLVGHAGQYLILLAGLLAGAFLAVYQITRGQATAGDFVMLLTYWSQLTSPLRYFSQLGRSISQKLVHAERLLDVMLTKPTVVDKPGARPLKLKGGKVEFRNVNFSYDKKKDILKGVKLCAPPGATVAFVGATGAGKSTVLKLLDRFYDVTGGSILIDGQDVRDVTMSSLRQSIGIVPQAPILFDDTVMNNIRYARLEATDEEVYSACKAAAIHDQIMGFTEGYQTRVGERGVKISGGELQRIAIARAILKRPDIVLLDEATSSVDTDTEQKIQDGLKVLCQDRTTLIVAHRLSTVMNADIIYVVSDGGVLEQGSHKELIAQGGKYAELWSKQVFVKPKEPEPDQQTGYGLTSTTNRNAQTDGSADEVHDHSSESGTVKQQMTPKRESATADNQVAGESRGRAVETPKGHKKEASKLNPGAAEFTPRSLALSRPAPVSPIRNNWAEDVEEDCGSLGLRAIIDPGTALSSSPARGYEAQSPSHPNSMNLSAELDSTIIDTEPLPEQGSTESAEVKPRRNTLQSISCPEPFLPFQMSPTRSVSQPVPTPSPAPQPTPAVPTSPTPPNKSAPKPEVEEPKEEAGPPRGSVRGRGSNRGRGRRFRGRNRRNVSNQKQGEASKTGSAPQQTFKTQPAGSKAK
ncbi:hypothetical protein F5Y15DRAFT_406132 [Xylariaceae sp. FL0016]|nr:hypothetical protein F5Y15DRAFT_406132 [Xylariaceae sp. FL0016]